MASDAVLAQRSAAGTITSWSLTAGPSVPACFAIRYVAYQPGVPTRCLVLPVVALAA